MNHGNIIIIIILPYRYINWIYIAAAQSSSHYTGEMAIRINSYPAGEFIPNTNQDAKVALGHLWYNLGLTHGSN